ncbi:MAG: hypothetical protein JO316_19120 [Abitibacteriaceae bacterium]|nr:hypothetical protein [Abditibacteriaceae bacterium]MBV9867469.1 hypothetical protein [Abditibacteriaceae bacterium]
MAKPINHDNVNTYVRCSRCGDTYLAPFANSKCLNCGYQRGGLTPFTCLTPFIFLILLLGGLYTIWWYSGYWTPTSLSHPPTQAVQQTHHRHSHKRA